MFRRRGGGGGGSEKRRGTCLSTFFSDHNGSLLRRQPKHTNAPYVGNVTGPLMEGVQLIIQKQGLMISAVPDGEDSEASNRSRKGSG